MKTQTESVKNARGVRAEGHRNRLQKQAELRGVPVFALRMLAARRLPFNDSETTLRYRHD